VIGAGGLGHVAIQLLRELTATYVVALDIGEDKLAFAREVGAHEALESDREAARAVKRLSGGRGADVVLDFVGTGGGSAHVGFATAPLDVTVSTSTWGRRNELIELVAMARRGQIAIRTTPFALEDGLDAYRLPHERKINGRAVIVPSYARGRIARSTRRAAPKSHSCQRTVRVT
jgi:propanol-preferring alcohol dehydrogenase